MRLLYLFLCQ